MAYIMHNGNKCVGSNIPNVLKDNTQYVSENISKVVEAGDWQYHNLEDVYAEGLYQTPVIQNTIAIEEENSSDNFPAIGHFDRIEIKTAEDGSLLPSTVNAKMADGSYQRLTLYPQIVDGNVTCTVQFENPQEKQADASNGAILDKIDQLILQNEDIVNSVEMPHPVITKPILTPKPVKRPPFRPALIPSYRRKPTNLVSTQPQVNKVLDSLNKRKRTSVIRHTTNKIDSSRSLLKRPRLVQPIASKLFNANVTDYIRSAHSIPTRETITNTQIVSEIQQTPQKVNNRVIRANQNQKQVPREKLASIAVSSVKNSPGSSGVHVLAPHEDKVASKSNTSTLGSTSNPITLIKDGGIYQSKDPLSTEQLRQISAILRKHKDNLTSEDYLIDPLTKTRILYKVVYPTEATEESTAKTNNKKNKRGRKKRETATAEPIESNNTENCDGSAVGRNDTDAETGAEQRPTQAIVLSRTRSGRLSRPPKHMLKDYKRIDGGLDIDKLDDQITSPDIETIEEVSPAVSATPTIPINQYLTSRTVKKSINVKSDYRCPTCKKIYLGHQRMMHHLRKFPHHRSLSEYTHSISTPQPPIKSRINKRKLMKIISKMERATYGPILAKAFTTWEFLLLQVGLLDKTGTNEVEMVLKELYTLLGKFRTVLEDLLVPTYGNEAEQEHPCVVLDKLDVSYALGMAQGSYRIKKEKLHLLQLDTDPPCPPAAPSVPKPTQLATKFEPNLSNKFDCSNDSIDLDCSSKDAKNDEEKKDWVPNRVEDTNSEFLTEFLKNDLPPVPDEGLALWKYNPEIIGETTSEANENHWTDPKSRPSEEQPEMWKDGESPCAASSVDLWKETKAGKNWNGGNSADHRSDWKEGSDSVWTNNAINNDKNENGTMWTSKDGVQAWDKSDKWDGSSLRAWKEDGVPATAVPSMRTSRLTSTPETASVLFSPPLRRNSVSGFTPAHQEELLSLDLHELFDELIPEQTKPQPKPGSIESIINEALFPGDETPSAHTSIPPLIPDTLDEFGFS